MKKKSKRTQSQIGRGSRQKGSNAERAACLLLSEYWFQRSYKGVSANELPFFRTPRSGGWARRRSSKSKIVQQTSGDIVVPEEFPFLPEIKAREEWSWDTFMKGSDGWAVWKYWDQAAECALIAGKKPLLLFTRNYQPWYIALYASDAKAIKLKIIAHGVHNHQHIDFSRFGLLEEILPHFIRRKLAKDRSE